MIHLVPTRTTSILVIREQSDLGRHIAEDMHGFECFIDADSAIEPQVRLGMIFQAEIDHEGRVLRASQSNHRS